MNSAGMDDFFNPGGEYSSPVDVEATLSSLLGSTPPANSFDFSGSLLGSPPTYRTFSQPVPTTATLTESQTYSITPPGTINTSVNGAADTKRKRRRKGDESALPDEVIKGFDFTPFQSPTAPNFPIYDTNTLQPLNAAFDLNVFKSGTNTHYSAPDTAWFCYRQNQFKVYCYLKSPACHMRVRDGALDVDVQQFYAKLYAVKSTSAGVIDELQVGLFHAGKSRVKKEKTEIVPVAFNDGKVEFTNLQFGSSNASKSQHEFFHLAVTLYARSNASYYPILSKISPRIIVRSQHPGFYGNTTQSNDTETNTSTSATSSEVSTSPKMIDEQLWQQSGSGDPFHMGKVGINTSDPSEALTVHGNALITGNLYKPSDRRIKSDFVAVSPTEQLDHIRNLKIYDYKVQDRPERGVIAQELQKVMAPAVYEAGDVNVNGTVIPNLLVVNERSLLYENIGATQQLDKDLNKEKDTIIQIDKKVDDLATSTERTNAELKDQIRTLADVLFREEISKHEMGQSGYTEENIVLGLNLFQMGPTRSLMVLGYFYEYLWLVGALFIFSSIGSRRILGRACIFKFCLWMIIFRFAAIKRGPDFIPWISYLIGLILLLGNYIRHKRRMKAKAKGKESRCGYFHDWLYNACTCILGKTRTYSNEEDERESFIPKQQ